MAPVGYHVHVYGPWEHVVDEDDLDRWERRCQVVGCSWRQGTTVDPERPATPVDRALNRLAGIGD